MPCGAWLRWRWCFFTSPRASTSCTHSPHASNGPARALLALALALAGLVHGAASGRLPVLRLSVLVWLGAISYPLYLLHEFIGWSLMLKVLRSGGTPWLALLLALLASFALAQLVSMAVEKPAMHAIRKRWKDRRPQQTPA